MEDKPTALPARKPASSCPPSAERCAQFRAWVERNVPSQQPLTSNTPARG